VGTLVVLAGAQVAPAGEAHPPSSLRGTRFVWVGLLLNGAGGAGSLDPGFAALDTRALDHYAGETLRSVGRWSFLPPDATFWGQEATAGTVVFAALVVSRAEVTTIAHRAIDRARHTAWITASLELFNVQTGVIYHSTAVSGYRSLVQPAALPLGPMPRLRLLYDALVELIPHVVHRAEQRFDPDFVLGVTLPDAAPPGMVVVRASGSARLTPGQYFQTLAACCRAPSGRPVQCRLPVVGVRGDRVTLQAPAGIAIGPGQRVYTVANKHDPPGVAACALSDLRLGPSASSLEADLPFLRLQLHDLIAATGRLSLVSPLDVVWDQRALERLRRQAMVSLGEVATRLHRRRPSFGITAAIASLERRQTRANLVEQEMGYFAIAIAQIAELQWAGYGAPEPVGRVPRTGVIEGKGVALSKVLPGKVVMDRDLYLVAAQDAIAAVAEQVATQGASVARAW